MRRMYTPLNSPRQALSFVPLIERATHEFLRKVSSNTDSSTVMVLLRLCVTRRSTIGSMELTFAL